MNSSGAKSPGSSFQELAVRHLRTVLDKRGFTTTFRQAASGERPLVATFVHGGKAHEIEIFEDSVVMTSGRQLFEIFLRDEFGSSEIEITSFTKRLDRYLQGGEW